MRDPRDVIVSRHGKSKDMFYSNIRLWRELHACARPLFGHDRFLNIRYEDFVNNPDATQSQITAKFPWLEKQHKFSEYHEHAQVSEKSKVAMPALNVKLRKLSSENCAFFESKFPNVSWSFHPNCNTV